MYLVSTTKSLILKLRDNGWEPLLTSVISFYEQHEIDIPYMNASCGRKHPHHTSFWVNTPWPRMDHGKGV